MKKISSLLLAISISSMLQAQEKLTKSQQAVQLTVIKMFDALSNRDSVSLKDYCTADILLFENGLVWNADTLILKAITQNQAADFKRINSFEFINTTVNKNSGWATYQLQSEITRNGKQGSVKWMETVVLVKEKKRWKIKVLHSTLIKRT
jgi:ketosteroid isomerase-like protein